MRNDAAGREPGFGFPEVVQSQRGGLFIAFNDGRLVALFYGTPRPGARPGVGARATSSRLAGLSLREIEDLRVGRDGRAWEMAGSRRVHVRGPILADAEGRLYAVRGDDAPTALAAWEEEMLSPPGPTPGGGGGSPPASSPGGGGGSPPGGGPAPGGGDGGGGGFGPPAPNAPNPQGPAPRSPTGPPPGGRPPDEDPREELDPRRRRRRKLSLD